jgi:hypothetical protein
MARQALQGTAQCAGNTTAEPIPPLFCQPLWQDFGESDTRALFI